MQEIFQSTFHIVLKLNLITPTCPTTFAKAKVFLNLSLFSHLPKIFPLLKAQLKDCLLYSIFPIEVFASPKALISPLCTPMGLSHLLKEHVPLLR